jgi:hypothetical protein
MARFTVGLSLLLLFTLFVVAQNSDSNKLVDTAQSINTLSSGNQHTNVVLDRNANLSLALKSDSRNTGASTAYRFPVGEVSDPGETMLAAASTVDGIDSGPPDFAACGTSGGVHPILLAGTATFLDSPSPRSRWEVTRHQQRFSVKVLPGAVIVYSDTGMRFNGFTLMPISDIKSIASPRHENDLWLVEIESSSLFKTVAVYSGQKTYSSYVDVPFPSRKDANQAIQVIGRLSTQPGCSR